MSRHLAKLSGAALAALALVATANVSATADPSPLPDPTDCNPAFRTYAAVGSDTTQDVWNGLSNGGPISSVASWNAFGGASSIVTKCTGDSYTRPAGSGAGVRALSAVHDPAYTSHSYGGGVLDTYDVDFARSSSGPSATGSALTYIPFARDAVSVAYNPYSTLTGLNLTTAQLTEIYSGSDGDNGDGVTFPTASQPQVNGVNVYPKLPQPSSGTRAFFLAAIGVGGTGQPALGSYVEPSPSTLPENDGSVLATDGWLIPFSAAQWIAQKNAAVTDTTSGLEIASVNGSAPTSGSSPVVPGALFGSTNGSGDYNTVPASGVGTFNRDVYNVVPSFFEDSTEDHELDLWDLLTGSASGQIGASAADTVVRTYGFGTLSYIGSNFKTGPYLH